MDKAYACFTRVLWILLIILVGTAAYPISNSMILAGELMKKCLLILGCC